MKVGVGQHEDGSVWLLTEERGVAQLPAEVGPEVHSIVSEMIEQRRWRDLACFWLGAAYGAGVVNAIDYLASGAAIPKNENDDLGENVIRFPGGEG